MTRPPPDAAFPPAAAAARWAAFAQTARDHAQAARVWLQHEWRRLPLGWAAVTFLLLSGLFHGGLLAVSMSLAQPIATAQDPRVPGQAAGHAPGLIRPAWEGPTSWRKPMLFGVSSAVTLASALWVISLRASRPIGPAGADRLLANTLAAALVVEVGLITLQCWRGVRSHFNHDTAVDLAIHLTIDALIILATALLCVVTARAFGPLGRWPMSQPWQPIEPDMRLAICVGMLLLVGSCLLGFVTLGIGLAQSLRGIAPEIFGQAGVLKFPHGIAIHAVQVLPTTVILGRWLGWSQDRRVRAVWVVALLHVLAVIYACAQTFSGRGRLEL